ncbi:GNAT family N-acetyltransferase [Thermopolyspora sp. NPDC052614]|uniref:GNAT family N-acetyltransferase n=1 Tax=Thermopolyspora sp. NPDC052614 TaxID=3155682 RepID=UPI00342D5FF1
MLDLQVCDRNAVAAMFNEFVDVYAEVYGVPPYADDPFFSVETFADRLRATIELDGFEAVIAKVGGQLAGYVYGPKLPATQPWWVALAEARPKAVDEAVWNGQVFWLRELMVCESFRSQGLGRRLHDAILEVRAEPYIALTCIVGNEPAYSAYLRWGYQILGRIKHAPESPLYDAMLFENSTN